MSHFLAIFLPLIDQLKANHLAVAPGFNAKEATDIIDTHWEDFLEAENHSEFGIFLQLIEVIFRIAEGKLDDHKEIPSNILSTFMGEMFKATFLLMCRNLYLQYCSIATQHRISKQTIINHLQAEYTKIASEKQALEADILKTITALQIPISANPLSLPKPNIPKLDQIRLNILSAYYQTLLNKINTSASPALDQTGENPTPMTIERIKTLIDSDLLAAFAAMDRLEWGNRRGDYFALKQQWIDPPVGTSTSDLRNRLKLILDYAQLPAGVETIRKQAKEKLIRGTDLAIEYLEGKLKEGPTKSNLGLINADWLSYRKDEMLGLLDFHQKQLKANTLRMSVMTFIDGLIEDDLL